MMSGANCAARLSHHNPWTCGNLAGFRKRDEFREKNDVKNLLLIFKFQFFLPLLFVDGGQFIR